MQQVKKYIAREILNADGPTKVYKYYYPTYCVVYIQREGIEGSLKIVVDYLAKGEIPSHLK